MGEGAVVVVGDEVEVVVVVGKALVVGGAVGVVYTLSVVLVVVLEGTTEVPVLEAEEPPVTVPVLII